MLKQSISTYPAINQYLDRWLKRSPRLQFAERKTFLHCGCREIFKGALKEFGYDDKIYGLHSLRSGGITSVVNNNGTKSVSERLLKIHGRWKTDVAKDMYMKESEDNRFVVSRTLGL